MRVETNRSTVPIFTFGDWGNKRTVKMNFQEENHVIHQLKTKVFMALDELGISTKVALLLPVPRKGDLGPFYDIHLNGEEFQHPFLIEQKIKFNLGNLYRLKINEIHTYHLEDDFIQKISQHGNRSQTMNGMLELLQRKMGVEYLKEGYAVWIE